MRNRETKDARISKVVGCSNAEFNKRKGGLTMHPFEREMGMRLEKMGIVGDVEKAFEYAEAVLAAYEGFLEDFQPHAKVTHSHIHDARMSLPTDPDDWDGEMIS